MSSVTQPTQHRTGPPMSESVKETQALAKRVVEGEIVDAPTFNAKVVEWQQQGFNVLTPAVSLSTIPRDHRIVVNKVVLNPNPAAGEVYQNDLFCKAGEVALSKTGLEKIAQCAGISIDDSKRVDTGTVPHVWSYRVAGHWIGFDGNRIDRVANKTIDFRDGSPDIKGFTANQIVQARRHGEAICESKALNRLYRQYGLKQKYTQRELTERPFIVLKLQWEPDMSNPIVAALVTQQRLGATNLMYPQALPSAVDPATTPTHLLPPELRPAGPAQEERDEDDIPMGDVRRLPRRGRRRRSRSTPSPTCAAIRPAATTSRPRRRATSACTPTTRPSRRRAQGARSLGLLVFLTFDPSSPAGTRRVTALRLGDEAS
jgi:hypothetical protein